MLRRIGDDVFNDNMIVAINPNKSNSVIDIYLLGKIIIQVKDKTLDEVFAFLQSYDSTMK